MKDLEKQSFCVKFCFKLGETFTETFQTLQQAYGEDCLSSTQFSRVVPAFQFGQNVHRRRLQYIAFYIKNSHVDLITFECNSNRKVCRPLIWKVFFWDNSVSILFAYCTILG